MNSPRREAANTRLGCQAVWEPEGLIDITMTANRITYLARRLAPPPEHDGTALRPAFRRWGSSPRGFTLIELLIVVVIIGALAGMAVPSLQQHTDRAKVAVAIEEIRTLQSEITGYQADGGTPPGTLADIGRADMLDPWGNPYVYVSFEGIKGNGSKRKDRFLVPLNTDYDLCSMGKDGITSPPLTAEESGDDVIRANDGSFIGLASSY